MKISHDLRDVGKFTKFDVTYFRWYCACGSVGEKRDTDDVARVSHEEHVKRWTS